MVEPPQPAAPLRMAPRLATPPPAPAFTVQSSSTRPEIAAPPKAAPKSSGVGIIVAVVMLLVLGGLGAGGYYFYTHRNNAPSDRDIRTLVEKQVTDPQLKLTDVKSTLAPAGTDQLDGQFDAVAELRDSLYEQADTAAVLRDELKIDVDSWQKAHETITGKDGGRILELAGLKSIDDSLVKTVYVKSVAPKGKKIPFSGHLHAAKVNGAWQLTATPGAPPAAPAGQPRSAFGDHAVALGDTAAMDKLRELAKAQSDVPARIEKARQTVVEERRANLEKMTAQLASELTPGTVFAGTATGSTGTPEKLYLEITAVQDRQVSALLRNEGGWADARPFQGSFSGDPEDNSLKVALATQRNQAIRKAGPFLERNEGWQVIFTFADGKLTGHNGEWTYEFARLTPDQVAATRQRLLGPAGELQAETAAGKVYRGSASAKSSTDVIDFLLRFTRQENDGAAIGAVLEAPGHPNWQRAFHGGIIASRQKADGWPLRLDTGRGDALKNSSANILLTAREDYTIKVKLVDGHLIGESRDFNWDFVPASAEEAATPAVDAAAARKEFLNVVKSGSSFTGRAHAENGDHPERIRVRFTLVDQRSGTVEALLESLETSGLNREFKGTLEFADGHLTIASASTVRGKPGRAVHFPAFTDNADATLVFSLDGEKLSADATPSGWKLEF